MSGHQGKGWSRRIRTGMLAGGVALLLCSNVRAALFMEEGFNYPTGQLATNGNWTNASSNINVTASNLTYPGLADAAIPGNDVTVTSGVSAGTTSSIFNASPITAGSVFYSFVAQVTTLPTANNYLTSLLLPATSPNGSTDPLAVYVGIQSTGSPNYKIGIRHQGNGSGATYAASNPALTLNSIHFFVVQYTFNPSTTTDDSINLYVDPVPGAAQPAANVTVSGGTDATSLQVIGFKAQSSAGAGNWIFDTLRVGDTWEDVTVPEPATGTIFVLAAMGLAARRRVRC